MRATTAFCWLLFCGAALAFALAAEAAGSAPIMGPAPWPLQQLPVTLGGGASDNLVRLTSFGGLADGHTDNAPAFARALAQLGRDGGGTLVVPRAPADAAGSTESVYASMPILVNVSQVTLRLEEGTRLLALCNISAWPTRSPWDSFPTSKPQMKSYYVPFVHALNVTDFVLDGGGVIDGQGACWWTADCPPNDPVCRGHLLAHERPRLVVAEGAHRVSLADFTATMSAFWTVVLFQSSDIHVRNVTVRNPSGGTGPCHSIPPVLPCYGSNADGIDLVSVTRALVEEMDVVAGDDCFCVKSGEDAPGRAVGIPSRDIRFRNNFARHCSNPHQFGGLADPSTGFKIGTEMSGGVFNVLVEDNKVGYAGQAVKVHLLRQYELCHRIHHSATAYTLSHIY
jgi:polygalacturonase